MIAATVFMIAIATALIDILACIHTDVVFVAFLLTTSGTGVSIATTCLIFF